MTSLLIGLVFGLHLICVNVAAAGPMVAAAFDFMAGRGNALADQAGRYLAGWALVLLLPGGLLGAVVGCLLWDDGYRQLLERFPSKIQFGLAEIVFSLVLMAGQYWWWIKRPQCAGWERGLRIFVAVLASSNLLYHFPLLFAVIEQVATSSEAAGDVITASDFRARMANPQVVSRATHFILAAFAMCGVMLLGLSLRMRRKNADEAECQRVAVWGGRIALVPTLLQIPVGLWLTASLSPVLQGYVTGGDALTCLLFLASLAAAFGLLQVLAAIAIGDTERAKLIRAMALMVLVVLMMSGVLQRLRAAALELAAPKTVAAQADTMAF